MDNRTKTFDAQFEIGVLKTEIAMLKHQIEAMKNMSQLWPMQPPIFGPQPINPWDNNIAYRTDLKGFWLTENNTDVNKGEQT